MAKEFLISFAIGAALKGTFNAVLGRSISQFNKLGSEIDEVESRSRKLGDGGKRLGATAAALRKQQAQLGAAIKQRDAILGKREAMRGQMVDAVALGAAIYGPVNAAIQFESVMADVKKVVDFDTPEQFAAMQKDILGLSTVIPMSAQGIGDIVAAAGQAGIAREELVQFATDAAKMGVAFDMSGAQAGSAMTGLRSIFHLNQQEAVSLGDAYNHLSNNMDATARDMLNIANRVGSTGDLFGISGQQVGALGATFLALKTPPEVASTGINALLLKLKTADKQGDKFQTALENMGMSAEGLKASIEDDAQGALLDFLETVKGAEDVTGTLSDMFGMEYSDDMAKLVGNLGMYRDALGLVAAETDYAGSMQKEFEERANTTQNNLELFRNKLTRLGVTIGSVVLPALNLVVGGVGYLADGAAFLAEQFPLATKVLVGFTVGLIAMKVGAIAVGYAWTFVSGGWATARLALVGLRTGVMMANARLGLFNATTLVTAARTRALAVGGAIKAFGGMLLSLAGQIIPVAIGGFRALSLAVITNPIGIAVTAIALGAVLILKYWKPIAKFFSGLWKSVGKWFGKKSKVTAEVEEPAMPSLPGDAVAKGYNPKPSRPPVPIKRVGLATAPARAGAMAGRGQDGPISIQVNAKDGQSAKQVADEVMRRMERERGRRMHD
ncbi:hypothetical protein DSLASN_02580 [Desulfoluna limicola]|uniref:Phage tail tape measure protein domain-containing protein n=1 Tax=Desulfoluna limicola TaxID=2810562 RepID=A0ABM7PAH4_9BACT|nr:phage tail tape measure protein [Desulfoluna limicola]BCS94626.1 hypothetical protein DSLASN_02580 [Desulfoluna limicola]